MQIVFDIFIITCIGIALLDVILKDATKDSGYMKTIYPDWNNKLNK